MRQPPAPHGPVVLDRDRHAGERPRVAGRDLAGGGQRAVAVDVDERLQPAVELLDAPHRGLRELAGAHSAPAHEPGEVGDGAEHEIGLRGGGHGAAI